MCHDIYMRLSLKQLMRLKVETVSGVKLGRVCDIIFETDGQTILQYEVCGCCLFGKKFLINRSQVVRFEEKKMVVDDTVSQVEIKSEKVKSSTVEVGAMMSELKD